MALSKYTSTHETTNFARVAMIILGPCTDVLQDILRKEVPPSDFAHIVNIFFTNLPTHKTPTISMKQKRLALSGKYSEFDISLLYYLLSNMCSIREHDNHWGHVPNSEDRCVSANIERIRILRVEYGHASNRSLSDEDFNQKWKYIFQIVKELEFYLGTATGYQDDLTELKTCPIDPEARKEYIEKLLVVENMQVNLANLKEKVKECKRIFGSGNLEESDRDRAIFEQWKEDDETFFPTTACKQIEELIRKQNLVIVTGHSGSGKSAIVQHIALKFRNEGWIVKLVYEVKDILNQYSSKLENNAIFVIDDPFGKFYIDEIAFRAWKTCEEKLKICLKKIKLLLSSRKYIINDVKVKGIVRDKSNIIDISNDQFKLSTEEKEQLLSKHALKEQLSVEEIASVVQTEAYFPLLCELYCSRENQQKDILKFFKEPVAVYEEEIRGFKGSYKEFYCVLVLLLLFEDGLCLQDIQSCEISKRIFKHALELCEMKKNTAPYIMKDCLESLEGFFVKKIGETYYFYDKTVMEATSCVFGRDNLNDTVMS